MRGSLQYLLQMGRGISFICEFVAISLYLYEYAFASLLVLTGYFFLDELSMKCQLQFRVKISAGIFGSHMGL